MELDEREIDHSGESKNGNTAEKHRQVILKSGYTSK